MKKIYYLLAVDGGVEPFVEGPYRTKDERDRAARHIHERQKEDDSVFWADIDKVGALTVGTYTAGFFCQDSAEDASVD